MNWIEALSLVAEEALEKAVTLSEDDRLVWWCVYRLVGAKNATTSRALAEGLGWEGSSDDVKVRHCVERLVRAGLPVCSSRRRPHFGYYVPASEEELRAALAPIQSEAAERYARADALELTRVQIRLTLDGYPHPLTIPKRVKPEPKSQLSLV